MSNRVGVVLSGCGNKDGSEIRETIFTLLSLERAGAQSLCAAPDVSIDKVVDHRPSAGESAGGPPRSALAEAARLARGDIRPLSALRVEDIDALILPGGLGVGSVLSNYDDKRATCDVNPDLVRLLRGCLAARKPMGFICLAPILAARVLGPVAGVRLTLGAKGSIPAKYAAIMGADVRPCLPTEIVVDEKSRVVSTPAYMFDDISLSDVAAAVDRLVRTTLGLMPRNQSATVPPSRPAPEKPAPAPAPVRDPSLPLRREGRSRS